MKTRARTSKSAPLVRPESSTQRRVSVVPLLTIEARLKRALRSHLRLLGFTRTEEGGLAPPGCSKDSFRRLHGLQRRERLQTEREFIVEQWPLLRGHFANGSEVDPSRVAPRLELIQAQTWQSNLIRLTALTWSVPVSQGYGRRMRFLVWDETNCKRRILGEAAVHEARHGGKAYFCAALGDWERALGFAPRLKEP